MGIVNKLSRLALICVHTEFSDGIWRALCSILCLVIANVFYMVNIVDKPFTFEILAWCLLPVLALILIAGFTKNPLELS